MALLTAPAMPGAADVVWVRRFDPTLATTGAAVWRARGTVEQVVAAPGGDLLALVAEGAARALARWSPEGKERWYRPLELRGRLLSARAAADGGLVLATDAEAVRLGPDGASLARRPLTIAEAPGAEPWERGVAAAADGVWVAEPGRLRFLGLGVPDAAAALPAPAVGEEVEPRAIRLFPTDAGDCLLAEWRSVARQVKGRRDVQPDRPGHRLLLLASRRGEILATRDLGPVRSSLEWLWRESGGPQAWGPGDFGLVRRRWESGPELVGTVVRADGGFVVLVGEGETGSGKLRLLGLDGRLAELWQVPWTRERPSAVSPGWARGLLFSTGSLLYATAADGRGERSGVLADPQGQEVPLPRGQAIGQQADGGWVVAQWGTP